MWICSFCLIQMKFWFLLSSSLLTQKGMARCTQYLVSGFEVSKTCFDEEDEHYRETRCIESYVF